MNDVEASSFWNDENEREIAEFYERTPSTALVSDGERTRLRPVQDEDVPALLKIEREAFEFPWTPEEFEYCLRSQNCGGFLVERGGIPLGYLFYETRRRSFRLLSVAVAKSARRQKLGSRLTWKLKSKANLQRPQIVCAVRERNVPAQLFLRSLGFQAEWIAKNYYSETNEDAYRMTLRVDENNFLCAEDFRRRLLNR